MESKRTLNVDVGRSISEFRAAMKEFELKYKLYRLILRGKGLEFDSYREYSPDEDAEAIDWKASMRANKLLARRYKEERNLKVVFIIDVGDNMVFGTTKKLKCEYAVEIIAAFAHLIVTSGDKIGYVLFSEDVKDYIKPSAGLKQFNRLIADISNPDIYSGMSNLSNALEFVLTYVNGIESAIIVSDFLNFDQVAARKLSLVANKVETVALMVKDPLDRALPNVSGELIVEDPKTGQQLLINPKLVRGAYERYSLEQENFLRGVCIRYDIDLLELITDKSFVPYLSGFLKGRVKKINLAKGIK